MLVAAGTRTTLAGLMKSLVKSPPDEALDLFEKLTGSTFSELSISKDSAFRLPAGKLLAEAATGMLTRDLHERH